MSINFPNNPDVNDQYTFDGKTWIWTGSKWNFIGTIPDQRTVIAPATTGTLTINSDVTDVYVAEGLTGAITFAQPTGSPANGQKLLIRLKDDGTARGITWTTSSGAFRAVGVELPTTTVLGKVTYIGCVYNSADTFWDVVASTTQD